MLGLCLRVYIGVWGIYVIVICPYKDILYTGTTEKLFNKNTSQGEKNV